jgi:hypothetical protein
MKTFMRKVWKNKSLPPMWMWKPTWFRRAAIFIYVPCSLALLVGVTLLQLSRFTPSSRRCRRRGRK